MQGRDGVVGLTFVSPLSLSLGRPTCCDEGLSGSVSNQGRWTDPSPEARPLYLEAILGPGTGDSHCSTHACHSAARVFRGLVSCFFSTSFPWGSPFLSCSIDSGPFSSKVHLRTLFFLFLKLCIPSHAWTDTHMHTQM